jgi:DNA-directed RNA polymerase specialized sigma24 family protein
VNRNLAREEALCRKHGGLARHAAQTATLGGLPPDATMDDIISAAYEGLWHAARHFDPSKGYQFSTYAWRCAWGKAKRYIERAWKSHAQDWFAAFQFAMDSHGIWRDNEAQDEYIDEHTAACRMHIIRGAVAAVQAETLKKPPRGTPCKPPYPAEMLRLYYFDELTDREIAKMYGQTQQAISSKRERYMVQIRRYVADELVREQQQRAA